jgi:nucleoside triphosphate diphosphatase
LSEITRLLEIMARLRDPETGCPWDREQTYASIVPHTIEEAYEVADSVAREDYSELRDELGDLLLQVVFYSQIAREEGRFCFDDVVASINDKLVRRHPHVFSDASYESEAARSEAWESQKARERDQKVGRPSGRLEGVAMALPALSRAVKLQKRAARAGFDWEDMEPVFDKIQEELEELRHEIREGAPRARLEDEMGDILFAATNLSRHLGLEPEAALRSTNRKFERRFGYMESRLEAQNRVLEECNLEELEQLWQEAKSEV